MTKLTSLSEAIAKYVNDGDTVYAAGFTHLIPFAAGHEIIRQGKKNLTLARATPDLIYDMMVAAGCAKKVIFSYMGNPGVGSLRIVRSAIEKGELEWDEYSHFGMITRLQAGASGLPFLPMNQTGATDLEKANPNIKRIPDPYGGKDVIVVPALNPDVAIVHVQRADANGNGVAGGASTCVSNDRWTCQSNGSWTSQDCAYSTPSTLSNPERLNADGLIPISRTSNSVGGCLACPGVAGSSSRAIRTWRRSSSS